MSVRELGPELQLKTPARWKAINQGLDYSTNTPYIMVERLVSKTKHLAPTASIMMKEHLNSIVNGEFWSAAKYTTDCLRIERLSHFSSLNLWVSEEIALADIKLRLRSLPGISQERRASIGSFDVSFEDTVC